MCHLINEFVNIFPWGLLKKNGSCSEMAKRKDAHKGDNGMAAKM